METPVPNFYFMGVQFLHLLALAVWVGGIIILQSIVAPTLLHVSPSRQAGDLVIHTIFKKFYKTTLLCAGVLLATSAVKFFNWENLTPWNAIRYLAISVMIFVSCYVSFRLFPRMDLLFASASDSENTFAPSMQLNRLCARSDRFLMVSLVCGIGAILLA